MSLYGRIKDRDLDIPEAFCMRAEAMCDIKEHSTDLFDLMCIVFKFGYMQGQRAERKAGTSHGINKSV